MFKRKPETILVTEVYINGRLADKVVKVVRPGPDYIKWIALSIIVPYGFWAMVMQGMFRG